MGLFDRLAGAIKNEVKERISDELEKLMEPERTLERGDSSQSGRNSKTKKSFDEKLKEIISNAGEYELLRKISINDLEAEFGKEIYLRGGNRCKPEDISYVVYKNGERVLYIRLWDSCTVYSRKANREIKSHCEKNDIKILDFFAYLPNEEDYMNERICEALI